MKKLREFWIQSNTILLEAPSTNESPFRGFHAREVSPELDTAYEEAEALIEHALALNYFSEGGSTEGWAKRVLAAIKEAKGEE